MALVIQYSEELEVKRILNTLSKMVWYREHGYNPVIPDGVNKENVEGVVGKNFIFEDYKKTEDDLRSKFDEHLIKKVEKQIGKNFNEDILVVLTKYGTAGSYNLPNKVIINFRTNKDIIKCLRHELIHLLVEEEVKKKGLNQKEKEKWVDELMEKSS